MTLKLVGEMLMQDLESTVMCTQANDFEFGCLKDVEASMKLVCDECLQKQGIERWMRGRWRFADDGGRGSEGRK
jgi:hypothetical protein